MGRDSNMTLIERLREFLKFSPKKLSEEFLRDGSLMDNANSDGGLYESARLERVHAALECVVQAAIDTKWNMENDFGRCGTTFIDEALAKLDAALTEGEK